MKRSPILSSKADYLMKNDEVAVSVVMAVYNGEEFLPAQLDSLMNQTRKPDEVLVLDDCSSDRSFEVLRQYAAKFPQIKLLKNDVNSGVNASFYSVIKRAAGDVIFCCDQDDIWSSIKIETFLNNWSGEEMLFSDAKVVSEAGHTLSESELAFHGGRLVRNSDPWFFLWGNCVSGHNLMLTNKVAEILPPVPEAVFYDQWISLISSLAGQIKFVDESTCVHRMHTSNASNNPEVRKANKKKNRSATKKERFKQKRNKMLVYLKALEEFDDADSEFNRVISALVYSYESGDFLFDVGLAVKLYKHKDRLFRNKTWMQKMTYIKNHCVGDLLYWIAL